MSESNEELSYGESAVGIKFNPDNRDDVHRAKSMYAEIINQADAIRSQAGASSEKKRLASIAITEAQTAQMWLVKALTWKD